MKNFFSRKYARIFAYNEIVDAQKKTSSNHNKLIIHTADGLYEGYLKLPEEYKSLELDKDDDFLTAARKLYLSILENPDNVKGTEVNENPITIDLEDVTLYTSMRNISLPFVSIFIDQIIGISLGHAGKIEGD